MDLQLEGCRAIVTGGSRGIGAAIARALVLEGADVAIVARDEARLASTAADLAAPSSRRVVPLVCDTSSDEQVTAMADAAAKALGGVDILVNAAARPGYDLPRTPIDGLTADVLWSELDIKVAGYLRCIRAVVPHMRKAGGGRIVNISGLAARSTGSTVGTIRNVAVAALTKTLADELAGDAITLVVVHPGFTRTERTPPEFSELVATANLLGRFVDADEVGAIAAFLASPLAVAINGDAVAVGGGTPGAIHY